MDPVVLVPVKSFAMAKARLAGVLSAEHRRLLARWMADRVVSAAGELPVFVACDDDDVAEWARGRGAAVLWRPDVGLNAAVDAGVAALRGQGASHIIVAHGDLPRATQLADVITRDVLTLVPDRQGDGTNVVSLPTQLPFEFSYGPGSFRRHLAQAVAADLPVSVRHDTLLGVDIDSPSDLAHPLVQEVLPSWLPTSPVNPTPSHR